MRSFANRVMVLVCLVPTAVSLRGGDCTPPPNETCDGEVVFTSDDLPYEVTAPLGCFNDVVDKPYMDIFYRYDCTCTGAHTVDMCDSSGDTYLRIYVGACGWNGGSEFAVADDECPGSPPNADPMLTVQLEAGVTYWFELGTWRPDPPWAPPPNSPYTFRVSQCQCTPPSIVSQPDGQLACIGQPATFSVIADGTAPLQYQWRKDGGDIPGATAPSHTIAAVAPEDAGQYDVVVTDACDSVVSAPADLIVASSGDFDGDGDVDEFDFAGFLACFSGPGAPFGDDCGCADGDLDGDADFGDFAVFQLAFSGS